GESDRINAAMTQMREYFRVDLPAKYHFCEVQGFVVRDAAAFDNRLDDAEFLREFAELFSAAVNDAQPDPNLVDQSQFLGKRCEICGIFGHFSRKFYDKCFA